MRADRLSRIERLLAALRSGAMDTVQLSGRLRVSVTDVGHALKRLEAEGRVTRDDSTRPFSWALRRD